MTKKTLRQLCREAENLGIRTPGNATQGKNDLKAAIRTTQTIKILQEAVARRKGAN